MPARRAEMLPPAFEAAKDHANGKIIDTDGIEVPRMVPVIFAGESYLIADRDEWPIEIMEFLESGEASHALKMILGDEQYERWRKGKKFKDIAAMYRAMETVFGGNS